MKIPHSSSRREFLVTASAAAAASVLPVSAREQAPRAAQWPIGCHTRPFTGFRASQAANPDYVLDAVKAAGFQSADMISPAPPGGRGAPVTPGDDCRLQGEADDAWTQVEHRQPADG